MACTHWKRCLSCLHQYGQLALVMEECPCIRRDGAARGREARGRAHGARAAAHRACGRAGHHVPQRRPGAPRKWRVHVGHCEVHNTQILRHVYAPVSAALPGFICLCGNQARPGSGVSNPETGLSPCCWYVVLPFAALAPCCSHVCLAPCLTSFSWLWGPLVMAPCLCSDTACVAHADGLAYPSSVHVAKHWPCWAWPNRT